ncbi:MAG: hypothetical protein Q9227_002155 [Pyrenula ochraceoflavens]
MPFSSSTWWTDQKIDTTVTRQFVVEQLKPDERPLVDKTLAFGDILTDDTYLDWILVRSRRLFLTLVEVGIPDQIFGLVDESYDDDDLPISYEAIKYLRLSFHPDSALDKRFYKAQFKFLVHPLKETEHNCFTEDEVIPVEATGFRISLPLLSREGLEKVRLADQPSKVYVQKRIDISRPDCPKEEDVLYEVAQLRRLQHQHLLSLYATYTAGSSVCIILKPATEITFKSFVQDQPKHFQTIPKPKRREMIVNWTHCLAEALAWLHSKGQHHGGIRPSNILIDDHYQVFFGQSEAFELIGNQELANDIEVYQYAAPEKWRTTLTVQTFGPAKTTGHSGGRTARRPSGSSPSMDGASTPGSEKRSSWVPDTHFQSSKLPVDHRQERNDESASPISTKRQPSTHNEDVITVFHNQASSVHSSKSSSSKSSGSVHSGAKLAVAGRDAKSSRINAYSRAAHSRTSSRSSGATYKSNNTLKASWTDSVAVPSPETRAAVVQTFRSSVDQSAFPSDIFALGAICIDILTFLCKKGVASFTRHRSAKNRTAGRGGGLADASFHANLGQVESWFTGLETEAQKKARKEDGQAFATIKPMLEILRPCMQKEPQKRPDATQLRDKLRDCIWRYANVSRLHCGSEDDDSAAVDQKPRDVLVLPPGKSQLKRSEPPTAQSVTAPNQARTLPGHKLHTKMHPDRTSSLAVNRGHPKTQLESVSLAKTSDSSLNSTVSPEVNTSDETLQRFATAGTSPIQPPPRSPLRRQHQSQTPYLDYSPQLNNHSHSSARWFDDRTEQSFSPPSPFETAGLAHPGHLWDPSCPSPSIAPEAMEGRDDTTTVLRDLGERSNWPLPINPRRPHR